MYSCAKIEYLGCVVLMLNVTGLECIRGDRQLFSSLDFSLKAGELLHVHGHNGSGKTTLLRTLCGLLTPEQGEIFWGEKSIHALGDDYRKDVVYFGHNNGIKDDLTGVENLHVLSTMDGVVSDEKQEWAALKEMGLAGYEDLPTGMLSQGQKKRVALARLLLSESLLWILDEPFTALDKAAVDHLQGVISAHLGCGGLVVLTTHQDVRLTSGETRQLQLGA